MNPVATVIVILIIACWHIALKLIEADRFKD